MTGTSGASAASASDRPGRKRVIEGRDLSTSVAAQTWSGRTMNESKPPVPKAPDPTLRHDRRFAGRVLRRTDRRGACPSTAIWRSPRSAAACLAQPDAESIGWHRCRRTIPGTPHEFPSLPRLWPTRSVSRMPDSRTPNRTSRRKSATTGFESTHSRLTIHVRKLPECDHAICISFAGPDPNWSLAFVEHLTRDCLLASGEAAESRTRSARAPRTRMAARSDAPLRTQSPLRCRKCSRQVFCELGGAGSNEVDSESLVRRAGALVIGRVPGAAEVNPEWQQLQTDLDGLAEQLRPLVEHLHTRIIRTSST